MSSLRNPMHPKRTGQSVETVVINSESSLTTVHDTDAEWHDAITNSLLTPTEERPLGGICVVDSGTPVEIKGCIPKQSNGQHETNGRWYIKKQSHDSLHSADGVYYFTVYAPRPSTPILAALIVPAATVDDLLEESWYHNNRRRVAKLSWSSLFDPEVVLGE